MTPDNTNQSDTDSTSDEWINQVTQKNRSDSESDEVVLSVEETVDDISDVESEELLKIPKGAIQDIYKRISELESETTQKSNRIETLESRIQELESEQQKLQSTTEILESRADHMSDFIQDLEARIDSLNESLVEKQNELDNRVTLLEENSDTETASTDTTKETVTNPNKLENYSKFDNDTLEKEFGVNTKRAVCIYRNFSNWSTRTSGGYRLKSGELLKLLDAKSSDQTLEWTQVHRAMKKFNELSPETYELLDTKSVGKAIIKRA